MTLQFIQLGVDYLICNTAMLIMASGGGFMYKPDYGDPVVTLRLPKGMIARAKIAAKRHDMSFSSLIRDLLSDRLDQEGINWCSLSETIPGQTTLDDVTNE
jgi:hypothetical protein